MDVVRDTVESGANADAPTMDAMIAIERNILYILVGIICGRSCTLNCMFSEGFTS